MSVDAGREDQEPDVTEGAGGAATAEERGTFQKMLGKEGIGCLQSLAMAGIGSFLIGFGILGLGPNPWTLLPWLFIILGVWLIWRAFRR